MHPRPSGPAEPALPPRDALGDVAQGEGLTRERPLGVPGGARRVEEQFGGRAVGRRFLVGRVGDPAVPRDQLGVLVAAPTDGRDARGTGRGDAHAGRLGADENRASPAVVDDVAHLVGAEQGVHRDAAHAGERGGEMGQGDLGGVAPVDGDRTTGRELHREQGVRRPVDDAVQRRPVQLDPLVGEGDLVVGAGTQDAEGHGPIVPRYSRLKSISRGDPNEGAR